QARLRVPVLPSDESLPCVERSVLWHIVDVRIEFIDGVALGLWLDHIPEQFHGVIKSCGLQADRAVSIEVCSQNVSREGERSSGMLLFARPIEVSGETDL